MSEWVSDQKIPWQSKWLEIEKAGQSVTGRAFTAAGFNANLSFPMKLCNEMLDLIRSSSWMMYISGHGRKLSISYRSCKARLQYIISKCIRQRRAAQNKFYCLRSVMHTLPTAILHCRLAGQDERRKGGKVCHLFFTAASIPPISFKPEISYGL